MDDIRIYNRALTLSEVEGLANGRYADGDNSVATYTLNTSLDVNNDLTLQSGILATGTNNQTVAGSFLNYAGAVAFTPSTSTLTMDAASGTKDILSGGESFYNLTLNDGGGTATFELEDSLTLLNNLLITGGTLDTKTGENNSITLAGNWTNNDTFTARSGTVTFNGSAQTIAGSSTFYNFMKTESADDSTDETLTFTAGTTQTITNTWTLDGRDSDDRINLVSSSPGTAWSVNPSGTRALDFLEVADSTNANATVATCTSDSCVSGGGNTNWDFDTVSPTISAVAAGNLTQTGATITWTSDELTSSLVDYGLTSSYGSATTETDTSPRVSSHSVSLTNLTCGSLYHFRVSGTDASDNMTQGSDATFTTSSCPTPAASEGGGDGDPLLDGDTLEDIAAFVGTLGGSVFSSNMSDTPPTVTVAPGEAITFQVKPVDADQVHTVTLTINTITYRLTDPDGDATFSVTLALTEPGTYPYTLTVDYGTTTRSSKGTIIVSPEATTTTVSLVPPTPRRITLNIPTINDELTFAADPEVVAIPAETTPEEFMTDTRPAAQPLLPQALSLLDKAGVIVATTLSTTWERLSVIVTQGGAWLRAALSATNDLLAGLGRVTLALARGLWGGVEAGGTFLATLTQEIYRTVASGSLASWDTLTSSFRQAWSRALAQAAETWSESLAAARGLFETSSNRLSQGWQSLTTLPSFHSSTSSEQAPDPRIPEDLKNHRYEQVHVLIANAEGQPLAGAQLTLFSEPQEATTDDQGQATFSNVPIGEHTLKIAWGSFRGEQSLFLNQAVPEVLVAVTPSMVEGVNPALTLMLVIGAILATALTAYYLTKKRYTGHFVV